MQNKLKKLSPSFKKILKVASQLAEDSGDKIYLVGGVVRDLLLNRLVLDLDIVVEKDAISFVERLADSLDSNFRRHHSFGTATLYHDNHKVDFATAREEKYSRPGALPKVKAACLDKDLLRRDFTINSMAISLNKKNYGQLLDFYGGLSDLKKGLIRVLHPESFLDDSLRILRAIRFEQRFSFKIEKKTDILLKQAVGAGALGWVNPHRLRKEVILFFAEPNPYRYIKRFYLLERFNFIDRYLVLDKKDFKFFIRAQHTINYYNQKIKQRNIEAWIIYLSGVLFKLSNGKVRKIVNLFGFKKGERIIITSIKENSKSVKRLDKKIKPSQIYKELEKYSYETILFFYAYFQQSNIRKNIRFFLKELSVVKLKLAGKDLKRMGVESSSFMGRILKELFYLKLDKGLKTKKQEAKEARRIISKLSKG